MKNRFDELAKQILHGLWEEDPVEATFQGIHAYDGVLSRADRGSREAYHRQRSSFLDYLKEYQERKDELDENRRLDLELLSSELEVSLHADDRFQMPERRADRYPAEALYGVYLLIMRQFAPIEERLEAVKERLLDTRRFLAEGMDNLLSGENIPAVWTEIGIKVAKSAEGFYNELIPKAANEVPALRAELTEAADDALSAMGEYVEFLEGDLIHRSRGRFAIVRESFDFLLSRRHYLPFDAQELREIGEEMIDSTQKELSEVAAQIGSGEGWPEIVDNLKDEHPRPGDLLAAYRRSMEEAKQFVLERDLVTLPPDEQLEVVETPLFERSTIPYAAYVPAAPFEERQDGFFWVTPVNPSAASEMQRDQLRGHCRWGIPITALHEGYPGHHLQLCRANRVDSMVRRRHYSTVFIEGWALYCEEMMEEQGFLSDPRRKLLRLKDQLWRACRVVIDVGLHCFGMSFDDAVEVLVNVAKLERENAVTEVRRYTQTPTQPMSYLIGKLEMQRLRDNVQAVEGTNFVLKDFHDRLLSYGSLPVEIIKNAIMREQEGS